MNLPAAYAWLATIDPPRIIDEALALLGVQEKQGAQSNPIILGWAREVGEKGYVADETPWCGLFAAVVVVRAGWESVVGPLWARNWQRFGGVAAQPALGDVLVFARGSGGHVGFYVGEDAQAYHVLGGNQGDAVSIVRISKDRLLAARRPLWRTAQPASVRPYQLAATGTLSNNEV